MTITYSYRRFEPGDELSINHLYKLVTGRDRSLEAFAWQWLKAPGGEGDIWLIEAVDEMGHGQLIGHHGMMPVRFTCGGTDLLFGKTENTMVLPEFRRKILYPKYERLFAAAYEPRFDALFSTSGHAAAIRQRKAHGYVMEHAWLYCEGALRAGASPIKVLPRLSRYCHPTFVNPVASLLRRKTAAGLQALDRLDAAAHPFFEDFWSEARHSTGIAPRRDREDLTWRFWENPYTKPVTLVIERHDLRGYAIVDTSNPYVASIQDAFVHPCTADTVERFFKWVGGWLASNSHAWLMGFYVTSDTYDAEVFSGLQKAFRQPLICRFYKNRDQNGSYMPRKVTKSGLEKNLSESRWAITPIVSEGRT